MSGVSRRGFLRASAVLGAAGARGAAGAAVAGGTAGRPEGVVEGPRAIPFDGAHQAGILTPRPNQATHVTFDLASRDPSALRQALQELTTTARALAAEGDELTVTMGLGASCFDERLGLADGRPPGLAALRRHPADALEAPSTDGDLLLQLCAATPDSVLRAHRELARATRGTLVPRWSVASFRPAGERNALGFVDGTGNPGPRDAAAMRRIVWVGAEAPAWARGGTHAVVRVIRTRVEAWDRTPLEEQEATIGRSRGAGRLRAGRPADSHVDRARPAGEPARMLRRPFTFARGLDPAGELDAGLLFCAFQRHPALGVDAALERMAGERLEAVARTVGGGAFFLPPGARGPRDWVGSGLFA